MCAGINWHEAEEEKSLRERTSDPLGPVIGPGAFSIGSASKDSHRPSDLGVTGEQLTWLSVRFGRGLFHLSLQIGGPVWQWNYDKISLASAIRDQIRPAQILSQTGRPREFATKTSASDRGC